VSKNENLEILAELSRRVEAATDEALRESGIVLGPNGKVEIPDDINPGIRETVRRLQEAGYETCDSGDGETHDHTCDRQEGYVVILLKDDDDIVEHVNKVGALLSSWGVDLSNPHHNGVLLQGNYGYADRLKMVDIHGIHDRILK